MVLLLLLLMVLQPFAVARIKQQKVVYMGGTLTNIPTRKEGVLSTRDSTAMVFHIAHISLRIAYKTILSLEYGEKAGRRVGVNIATKPVFSRPNQRRHLLTINFKDERGKEQAVVFELSKDIVRTTLAIIEKRTGKKIEYQDAGLEE